MINNDLERDSEALKIARIEQRKPSIELKSIKSRNTFTDQTFPLNKNESLRSKWNQAPSRSKQSGSQKDTLAAKKTLQMDSQTNDLKTAKMEELRKLMGGPAASRLLGKNAQNVRQETKGVVKVCLESISQWLKQGCSGCFRRFRRGKRSKQSKGKTNKQGQPSGEVSSPTAKSFQRRRGVLGSSASELNKTNEMEETAGGSSKDRRNSSMNSHVLSELEDVQEEIAEIREVIRIMSKEKMMEKGQRHLIDALLYRTVRHDLDGDTQRHKITLLIWKFQNSSIWNDFLLFLGWVYILMSFFEPANRNDNSLNSNSFSIMIGIETSILTLQTIDLAMELIQRSIQENLTFWNELIRRKKNFFRLLFFLLNISDLIYYASSYPSNTLRFARVIRPLQIIIFSKSLRRNFQGIISSAKNLLMILFLYIIITFLWAYIGVNMIGDLYNDENLDTYAMDFRDIFKASNVMYIFSTLDLYPDILFPAVESSYLYLLYFIPYLVMFLLLFAPIPVAVVYEGFRKHRLNILVADRIKRRKALWACFQCIVSDSKQSYIRKKDFVDFFSFVYSKVEMDEASQLISEVLWSELDSNDNKKVTIEEFFNVIDITEQRHEFRIQRMKAFKWWVVFRDFVEQKFNLQEFVLGKTFANLSLFITLASCALTIWGLFLDDTSDTQSVLDNLDIAFFTFFCLEIALKMIAFGPSNFFNESWNNFDFFLVVFQGFFNYIFVSFMKGSNVKSLSAGRVLKIAKLQKIFRMFRAFRTFKILNYILSGLDIIHKVYEILYKIVICIPIVMKLSVICVIVFYIYASIGVEIFSANLFASETLSQYGQSLCAPETPGEFFNSCEYSNFNTFGGAILILLQVCVGSGWGYLQFDYAKKYDLMVLSSFYFNSFHFLSVFVLSLIGGLVWEVFDVVERIMRDQQAYEQQLEVQRKWEEQQQFLEGSFQSVDASKKGSNTSKKRNSVQQSLASIAMMKLPMLSQKFHLSHPGSNLQELDEEDDESDSEGKQQKNPKVKVNHVMEKMLKKTAVHRHENFTDVMNKVEGVHGNSLGNEGTDDHKITILEKGIFKSQNGGVSQQQEPDHEEEDDDDDDNEEETDSDDDEEQDEHFNGDNQQTYAQNSAGKDNAKLSTDTRQPTVGIVSSSQRMQSPSSKQTNDRPTVLPKKKRRKRQHSIEIQNVIETKCAIDNPMISQRDLSQLILFQEVFKMSTIDAFFVNRTLKDPEQAEQTPEIENDVDKVADKQNINRENDGVEFKTAHFDVIKEEEEEYYEHNKTNMSQNPSFKKKTGLIQHPPSQFQNATPHVEARGKQFSPTKAELPIIPQDNIIIHSLENQIKDSPSNHYEYVHKNFQNSYDNLKKQFDTPSSIQNISENPMLMEGFALLKEKRSPKESLQKEEIGQECKQGNNQIDQNDHNSIQEGTLVSPSILDSPGERGNLLLQDKPQKLKAQHQQIVFKAGKNTEEFNKKQITSAGLIDEGSQNPQRISEIGVISANIIPTELNDIPLKHISSSDQIEQDSKSEYTSSKQVPRNKRRMQQLQNKLEISPIHQIPSGQTRKQHRTETQTSTFYTPYSTGFAELAKKFEESSGQLTLANNNNGHSNSTLSKQTKESSNNPLIDYDENSEEDNNTQISKKKNQQENSNSQNKVSRLQQSQDSHLGNKPGPFVEQSIQPMPEQKDLGEDGVLVTERSNQISSGNMIIETFLETVNHGNDKIEVMNVEQFFGRAEGSALQNKIGNNQRKFISKVVLQSKEKLSNSEILLTEEPNNQKEDIFQNLDGSFIREISDIHLDVGQEKQTHLKQDHWLQLTSAISGHTKPLSKQELKEHKLHLQEIKKKKKILEIENYYKSNLVEIEDGVGSQKIHGGHSQNTPIGKQGYPQFTSSPFGGSKSKSAEYKGIQRDIIKDAPFSKLLKEQLNNVNQDLRNRQQFQLRIDLTNMNYIINKAILKSVNIEKIHSIEMRHFRQLYGSSFEDLLDNEIIMLWNQQSKLLFHFDNLFKYDYAPIESFVQLYTGLEMQISAFLMNKFSSFKIIFQDQDDSWFTINYAHESYLLQEVENHGPWQYFDALFEGKDPKKLLKHRNIYAGTDQSLNIKRELKKCFQISQDISNNYFFRKLQINQKRSDTIYIPFVNDKIDDTQQKVLDILSSGTILPEYIMKDDLKLQWIPKIKKGLVVVHLFDNPIVKDRRRQFTSEILNIEQAIVEDDLIAQEQRNASLNYTQSIEFLKDIRAHINLNKEALFAKISSFYFYRSCFEKNFCDMSEVPFEQSLDE